MNMEKIDGVFRDTLTEATNAVTTNLVMKSLHEGKTVDPDNYAYIKNVAGTILESTGDYLIPDESELEIDVPEVEQEFDGDVNPEDVAGLVLEDENGNEFIVNDSGILVPFIEEGTDGGAPMGDAIVDASGVEADAGADEALAEADAEMDASLENPDNQVPGEVPAEQQEELEESTKVANVEGEQPEVLAENEQAKPSEAITESEVLGDGEVEVLTESEKTISQILSKLSI